MATQNIISLDRRVFYADVERKSEHGGSYFQRQEISIETDSFPYFFLLWLEHGLAFRVRSLHAKGRLNYTIRLRKMSGRAKPVWYAEMRHNGTLRQKYVGPSSDISLLKLEQLSNHFASIKWGN